MTLTASGAMADVSRLDSNPRLISTLLALGDSCRPAPASSRRGALSATMILKPLPASASAAVRPPMPAPATRTVARPPFTDGSRYLVHHHAFGRPRRAGSEIAGKAVQCRAIRADNFGVVAKIEE